MEINTKYEMGQKVYRARVIKRTFDIEETCDLCCGEKKINYKGYSCMCPKCDGEGKIITGQKTKLSREIQRPREITSVKVSFSIKGLSVRYKVNGHNVPEDELFLTMEEVEEHFIEDDKDVHQQ